MPLIHPFTHTFTHQRRLAAMQGTNQLVRSNRGLGVLLRDTLIRPGWDRTGNPPTARRQIYLLSHIAPKSGASLVRKKTKLLVILEWRWACSVFVTHVWTCTDRTAPGQHGPKHLKKRVNEISRYLLFSCLKPESLRFTQLQYTQHPLGNSCWFLPASHYCNSEFMLFFCFVIFCWRFLCISKTCHLNALPLLRAAYTSTALKYKMADCLPLRTWLFFIIAFGSLGDKRQ